MFVEVLLQLLVGEVDVELFKTVHLEVLKAKDVQDSSEDKFVLPPANTNVDLVQDPLEEVGVETHGGGVTRVRSLWLCVHVCTQGWCKF